MKKIYCVEDDDSIRELVVYALEQSGFEAEGFEDAAAFFAALHTSMPDLCLLDIMLPETDGMDILKSLRSSARTKDMPVIMLTAKSGEMDKVKGLDGGADDYITKPFGVMELISRVKALLRRTKDSEEEVFTHGGITLDNGRRSVTVDGKEISLTYKEYELLLLFLKNVGSVITRERLLSHVWGTDFEGESRTVDVHMGTLRQKLGASGGCIETIRDVGYIMK
ncbi:MAG: response regulator transcription factor [Clostridia bacterium]